MRPRPYSCLKAFARKEFVIEKTDGLGDADCVSQSSVVTELALPETTYEPDTMEQRSLSSSDALSSLTELIAARGRGGGERGDARRRPMVLVKIHLQNVSE